MRIKIPPFLEGIVTPKALNSLGQLSVILTIWFAIKSLQRTPYYVDLKKMEGDAEKVKQLREKYQQFLRKDVDLTRYRGGVAPERTNERYYSELDWQISDKRFVYKGE